MRRGFTGGGPASSNWRYLTEADRVGPRKDEMMLTTTFAKEQFAPYLLTRDLCNIEGYRRPGGRSTLTMYYETDLVACIVRQVGQERYGRETKHGRESSGVAAKEREEAAQKQAAAAQEAADRRPHAVVPAERLGNLYIGKLQEILIRCEGGKRGPLPPSKAGCIERIIAAGYSLEAEAEAMAKQKAEDEAEAARKAAALEQYRLQEEQRKAEAVAKAARAEEAKKVRAQQFAAGELAIEELKYQELQQQCSLHGVGKECAGKKKPEMLELLRKAMAGAAPPRSTAPSPEEAPAPPPPPPPPATVAKAVTTEAKTKTAVAATTPCTEVPASKKSRPEDEAVGEKRKPLPTADAESSKQLKPAQAATKQTGLMAFYARK